MGEREARHPPFTPPNAQRHDGVNSPASLFFTQHLRSTTRFRLAALRAGAQINACKGWCAMGDLVAVVYGFFVFGLLILYVTGCEKV